MTVQGPVQPEETFSSVHGTSICAVTFAVSPTRSQCGGDNRRHTVNKVCSCPLLVRVDTGPAAGLIPSMAPVQVFLYIACLLLPLLQC